MENLEILLLMILIKPIKSDDFVGLLRITFHTSMWKILEELLLHIFVISIDHNSVFVENKRVGLNKSMLEGKTSQK